MLLSDFQATGRVSADNSVLSWVLQESGREVLANFCHFGEKFEYVPKNWSKPHLFIIKKCTQKLRPLWRAKCLANCLAKLWPNIESDYCGQFVIRDGGGQFIHRTSLAFGAKQTERSHFMNCLLCTVYRLTVQSKCTVKMFAFPAAWKGEHFGCQRRKTKIIFYSSKRRPQTINADEVDGL